MALSAEIKTYMPTEKDAEKSTLKEAKNYSSFDKYRKAICAVLLGTGLVLSSQADSGRAEHKPWMPRPESTHTSSESRIYAVGETIFFVLPGFENNPGADLWPGKVIRPHFDQLGNITDYLVDPEKLGPDTISLNLVRSRQQPTSK